MRQERQVKSVILETIKKQKMLSAGIRSDRSSCGSADSAADTCQNHRYSDCR